MASPRASKGEGLAGLTERALGQRLPSARGGVVTAPFPGLDVALDLADRTRARIDVREFDGLLPRTVAATERARLDADLEHLRDAEAGLAEHKAWHGGGGSGECAGQLYVGECFDAARYARQRVRAWAGLQATAAAYGETL